MTWHKALFLLIGAGSARSPAPAAPPSSPSNAAAPSSSNAAASPPSVPADRVEQAKALNREGKARLDEGDIPAALAAFQRSHELVPSYQNTRNIALCLVRLGRHDEAHARYEEVLERFGGELPPGTRADTEAALAELKKRTAALTVLSARGGELSVDSADRGALPLKKPLVLMPGAHDVRVERRGEPPFVKRVVLEAGAALTIDVPPAAAAKPAPAGQKAPSRAASERGRGLFVEAMAGVAAGPSLGGDAAAAAAPDCGAHCSPALGPWFGVRLGRRFDIGLAIELSGGGLLLESSSRRTFSKPFSAPDGSLVDASYTLDDRPALRGAWAGAGASYTWALSRRFAMVPRLTIALLGAHVQDAATASVSSPPVSAQAQVAGADEARLSPGLLLLPELGFVARIGSFRVGVSLSAGISLLDGPLLRERVLYVKGGAARCVTGHEPDCAGPHALPAERAHGPFITAIPAVSIGYDL